MIISCEKCNTKYRLDSSRVSYAPVKVQCSKCDHVFIVPAAGGRGGAPSPPPPSMAPGPSPEERTEGGLETGPAGPLDQGPETGPEDLTGAAGPEEKTGSEAGEESPVPSPPASPDDSESWAAGMEEGSLLEGEKEEEETADSSGAAAAHENLGEEDSSDTSEDKGFSLNADPTGPEDLGGGREEIEEESSAGHEEDEGDGDGQEPWPETPAEENAPDQENAPEKSGESIGESTGPAEPAEDGGLGAADQADEDRDIDGGFDGGLESPADDAEAGMPDEPAVEETSSVEETPADEPGGLGAAEENTKMPLLGRGWPSKGAQDEDGPASTSPSTEEDGSADEEASDDFELTFETNALSFESEKGSSGQETGTAPFRADDSEIESPGPDEDEKEESSAGLSSEETSGAQDEFKFDFYDSDIAYEEPGLGIKEEWSPIPEGPWSGDNEATAEEAGSGGAGASTPEEPKDKEEKTETPPEGPGAAGADEKPSAGGQPSFDSEFMKAVSGGGGDEKGPSAEGAGDAGGPETPSEDGREKGSKTFVIPDVPPEVERIKGTGVARAVAIVIIVLAIAGGIIYMKTRPESPIMAEPFLERPIEIESTKGYYVVNRDGTRIFVIETMVRNVSDGPVKISGVRGLVMDSSGREMARKTVSPGRIVSSDDLKNLPVETLLASFRDTSEGTMPKRAVIPTMVIFTNLPSGVAEYGIDVLR